LPMYTINAYIWNCLVLDLEHISVNAFFGAANTV